MTNKSDTMLLGRTQSLCPECRALVPAKIIARDGRVYFRKTCPQHGTREDFVCSDVNRYDRLEYSVPAKPPGRFAVEPDQGCPFDCGMCTEHEQHTCIGLVELTAACNLSCPLCYAGSGPGGHHLSRADCCRAIDVLVANEGRPEILQLSGGEPTLHPEFADILRYALDQPIDYIMINTNGVRLAHDDALLKLIAQHRDRVEVYLQFDGLCDEVYQRLRGEPLLDVKLRAVERLGRAEVHVTLVSTLQTGVTDSEIGPLVEFAAARRWIGGISFQPATYSGRHVLPAQLESRLTFPDVIDAIDNQSNGLFGADDFFPLPCAHPNCHSVAYAYRTTDQIVPLNRFVDPLQNLDLLANGIAFRRPDARDLIERLLGRLGCCGGGDCGDSDASCVESGQDDANPWAIVTSPQAETRDWAALAAAIEPKWRNVATEFFSKALAQQLGTRDLFRITITSFLDVYNFDVRRVKKCCTHHVLPSGHVIPFCAYNVLYRDGHVPLPPLRQTTLLEVS